MGMVQLCAARSVPPRLIFGAGVAVGAAGLGVATGAVVATAVGAAAAGFVGAAVGAGTAGLVGAAVGAAGAQAADNSPINSKTRIL